MSELFRNVLVSAPNGGGLFLVRGGEVIRLDAMDATGIDYLDGIFIRGGQPDRLWIAGRTTVEIAGAVIDDVHDVLCVENFVYVVSTTGNQVVEFQIDGQESRRWVFPGESDSRHLNCLAHWRGELVFSAFGDFNSHRGYKGNTRGSGLVQSVLTGKVLISGLSQPHSLVPVGDRLLLANSEEFELHEYDDQARLVRKKTLPGYTRGICVDGSVLYIGLSKSRNVQEFGLESATILALDVATWTELGRMEVPAAEIYSLLIIPDDGKLLESVGRMGGHIATRLQAQVADLLIRERIGQEGIHRLVGERDAAIIAKEIAGRERDQACEDKCQAMAARDVAMVELGRCQAERDQAYADRAVAVADRIHAYVERDEVRRELVVALAERDAALKENAVTAIERDEARRLGDEYWRLKESMRQSRSWRLTRPLRFVGRLARGEFGTAFSPLAGNGFERMPALALRIRNALRYIVRGDFRGLLQRIRSYRQTVLARRQYAAISANCSSTEGLPTAAKTWGIMATQHTLFIAHLVADRLRGHGWIVEIFTRPPEHFSHAWYVVVCPQMFNRLPPGERRIVFQMEQSVSSRWFTQDYMDTLNNSLAVLEYALVNVEFLAKKGIAFPHVHYLPVGASQNYGQSLGSFESKYDVLFYGDCNSSPRRRKMLDALQQEFDVRVVSEVFGSEMLQIIKQARLVINLHYYEDALLEMPRIQECVSLGVVVISESARDQADYPELAGAVKFFEQGSIPAMIDAVRLALRDSELSEGVGMAAACGARRFEFMFDRFLVAMGFLPASHVSRMRLPLADDVKLVGLSLPETIVRRRVFEQVRPDDCVVFDGIRRHPGWVGCGLSYMSLAQHAARNGIARLAIMEDDALLPPDFGEKIEVVYEFLDSRPGKWDVFSGIIASLHSDTKVLSVEKYKGITFVTIDKMTSMVFNVYGEKILGLLASWDPANVDVICNAIDRYLEAQADLRIVVTLPYMVGHREEVHSTLWGFQNTQYSNMIAASEQSLADMIRAQGFVIPGVESSRA